MKRIAKQSGSRGRLRLGLLMATVAVFFLVPVAGASAAKIHVVFSGSGSGWTQPHEGLGGEPQIECHWNGSEIDIVKENGVEISGKHVCETEPILFEPGGNKGIKLHDEADTGSEFVKWQATGGTGETVCSGTDPCAVAYLGFGTITITATFEKTSEPNVHITIDGSGAGKVVGVEGEFEGTPPINCEYDGENQSGSCDAEAGLAFEVLPYILVEEQAAEGSEFAGWTIEEGSDPLGFEACVDPNYQQCGISPGYDEGTEEFTEVKLKATFVPAAPPNFWNLTAVKTGGGEGWVTSEDAGHALNCGLPCGERTASFEEGTVTLHAYGKQFTGWSGCTNEPTARQCEVNLEGDTTVEAEFLAPTGKLLTAKKVGGGQGWVTSLDAEHKLNCGLACPTERTVEFASGPVELRAYGSQFQGWTNCAGGVSGYQNRVCTMELNANETAEVEFE